MDPEVPPDRRMIEPGSLQDGRCPEGAGGQDDGRCPDRQPPDRLDPGDLGLDPDRATALEQDARHAGIGHDPGARRVRLGEMDPDARLLRATPAAERAAAAVAAGRRVAARRRRLPAEGPGTAQQDRVLGRDVGRLGDAEIGLDGARRRRPMGRRSRPRGRASVAHSCRTDLGRLDAGHPVDERAATDAGPGQHGDRAVPGRDQSVVEVEPVERVDLRASAWMPRSRTARPRARRPIDPRRPAPPPRRHRRHRTRRRPRRHRGHGVVRAGDRRRARTAGSVLRSRVIGGSSGR